MAYKGKLILRLTMKPVLIILSDQSVLCSVYTSHFSISKAYLNLVLGTVHRGNPTKSELYRAVLCSEKNAKSEATHCTEYKSVHNVQFCHVKKL